MASLHLHISTGDSRTFVVALEKDGSAFAPDPETGSLIVTVKHWYLDSDEEAVIQKATGAGVTLDGSTATLAILRADSVDLEAKQYFIEFLWQDSAMLLSQPVASGILDVDQRLTREQQTSVPVVTTDDPLPLAQGPTGPTGAIGPAGPAGATGPPGAAGSDATVTAANIAPAINATAEKTTPADADRIPWLDNAASLALKWLTFANLWAGIKAKLDTAMTIAGAKTFSAQLQLTGQSATDPASAMTRGLMLDEQLLAMGANRNSDDPALYTANGGTAGQVDGDSMTPGTTANSRPAAIRYRQINRLGSGNNTLVVPMRVATFGAFMCPADTPKIRCAVGMPSGSGVPAANADALSGRGFGWEIYRSSALGVNVIRLFAHNGTTYVTSAELSIGFDTLSSLDAFLLVIVGLASDGTVRLWSAFANNPASPLRPSATPTLTLAGGPTSGNFPSSGIQWAVVNHASTAGSASTQIKVLDRRLILD